MAGKVSLDGVSVLACVLVAFCASGAWAGTAQEQINYNKSWIYVDASAGGKALVEGDQWEVPVDYYLDPSEDDGNTKLSIWGTGPWIDCPDGKYEKKRHHVDYRGGWKMLAGSVKANRGRNHHVFRLTVPEALPLVKKYNRLLLICNFKDAEGKKWPWHVRAENRFVRKSGFFEIETGRPGNLFTYSEKVRVTVRLKNVKERGGRKRLLYKVHDVTGGEVAAGEVNFTVEKDGQEVPIELALEKRGVFLIELEVAGWEKRHTTFARIPDVQAVTRGERTCFGMTNALGEEECAIAQRLGLTACRRFTRWYRLEPGPGVYRLDDIEKELDTAKKYGIDVWLCIWSPPAWALDARARDIGYSCFRAKWDGWRDFVKTVTSRLRGKLYGWEWLNEITPGGSESAVDDYLKLCKIGTETAKAVDPGIITILAGGLWPRSYRISVLTAGVGKYVDVLPVHYSNGGGIHEARGDLDAVGCRHVAVWDDESGRGVNAWNVPPLEELAGTEQVNWVLTQWTDELIAGCEKIIYFGGGGSAAGNWSYLLDDLSPRPVAATLAVFTSKMHQAKPVGVFSLGEAGLFHLFDRGGKPLLVASTYHKRGEKVSLHVGNRRARITDYQGNESFLTAPGGKVELELAQLRYFLEDADLDVLKAYVVPSIQVSRVALKRSKLVEGPRVTLLKGTTGSMYVRLRNLYGRRLAGNFRVSLPEGWRAKQTFSFSLRPGEDKLVPVPLDVPEQAEARDYSAGVSFRFSWKKLPLIEKPVVFSVISPEMVGNLLPNGDFETADAKGDGPEGWKVDGKTKSWVSSSGLGDGLGEHVLKFSSTRGWGHCGRNIPLRGGQTYLYTAWVWNDNMSAGSNIYLYMTDGSKKSMYDVHVFTCGDRNQYWQVYTCRLKTPPNLKNVTFCPVVKGAGWAFFDNMRVTFFEGTDFAAECHKVRARPRIDGVLDEWVKECPIPLIGKNQLTVSDANYKWTPENLNAIGYLMWDESNLYVALSVRDDEHRAAGPGEAAVGGDSLILAFDPTNRSPEAEAKAFAYHVSSAKPGGGSGVHTIYRPRKHSAGLRSGHLFRDSSIYEMAIAKGEGTRVYEIRIPFSELGGIRPGFGGKFAFSIQLNDSDGGRVAAHMNWGGGISPTWRPADFGVVTFVE